MRLLRDSSIVRLINRSIILFVLFCIFPLYQKEIMSSSDNELSTLQDKNSCSGVKRNASIYYELKAMIESLSVAVTGKLETFEINVNNKFLAVDKKFLSVDRKLDDLNKNLSAEIQQLRNDVNDFRGETNERWLRG